MMRNKSWYTGVMTNEELKEKVTRLEAKIEELEEALEAWEEAFEHVYNSHSRLVKSK